MGKSSAQRQREYRQRRYEEIDAMLKIPCECGCGTLIAPINKLFKPARYAHGHNPDGEQTRFKPGQVSHNKGKRLGASPRGGIKLSAKEISQRTATRRAKYVGAYHSNDGLKSMLANRPKEWYENVTAAIKMRDISGTNNPFYGKKHSLETLYIMSEIKSGPKHPLWKGGIGTLPYGPEFTRKFKKLIRGRDNNTCQRCGKSKKPNGRNLHVHHIDHNKMNNDPTNLVTVCNSCNTYLHYHKDESTRESFNHPVSHVPDSPL